MTTKLKLYNKETGKLESAYWLSANPSGGTLKDRHHALAISTGLFGKQGEYYSGDIVECGSQNGKPMYDVVTYIQGEWEPICFYKNLKRVGTAFRHEDVKKYLGGKQDGKR